jgi:lysophospholipase L1-like esterase
MRRPRPVHVLFAAVTTAVVLGVLCLADQVAGRRDPVPIPPGDLLATHRAIRTKIAQEAARPKAPGEVRVYLFGGSTTQGVPYLMLPETLLKYYLAKANPERTFRIVNCGVGAGGFVRAALLVEDALRAGDLPGNARPDVVVVYEGHNEFLDYNNRFALVLEHRIGPRFVDALRSSWLVSHALRGAIPITRTNRALDPDAAGRTIGPRFAASLARLLSLTRSRGVPLVLCNPASNLADWPPTGDKARALYAKARAFAAEGRKDDALAFYSMARDHDAMAIRAVTKVTTKVLAVQPGPGVEVVDLNYLFIKRSGGNPPGRDLFLDNCHPNARGYALLLAAMARGVQRFVDPSRLPRIDDDLASAGQDAALTFARFVIEFSRPEEAFLEANLEVVNGHPERALPILDAALAAYPGNLRLRMKRISVLLALPGRHTDALYAAYLMRATADGARYLAEHAADTYYFPGVAGLLGEIHGDGPGR